MLGHTFADALRHTAPYAVGAFALCGLQSLLLPRTAVGEDVLTGGAPAGDDSVLESAGR